MATASTSPSSFKMDPSLVQSRAASRLRSAKTSNTAKNLRANHTCQVSANSLFLLWRRFVLFCSTWKFRFCISSCRTFLFILRLCRLSVTERLPGLLCSLMEAHQPSCLLWIDLFRQSHRRGWGGGLHWSDLLYFKKAYSFSRKTRNHPLSQSQISVWLNAPVVNPSPMSKGCYSHMVSFFKTGKSRKHETTAYKYLNDLLKHSDRCSSCKGINIIWQNDWLQVVTIVTEHRGRNSAKKLCKLLACQDGVT